MFTKFFLSNNVCQCWVQGVMSERPDLLRLFHAQLKKSTGFCFTKCAKLCSNCFFLSSNTCGLFILLDLCLSIFFGCLNSCNLFLDFCFLGLCTI